VGLNAEFAQAFRKITGSAPQSTDASIGRRNNDGS
jgi:hypothetical protein